MAIARVDFSVTSNTGKVSTHAVTKPPLAVTGNVGAVFTNINAASLTNEATLATQGWTKQYESFSTAHAICFTRIIDGTANDDFSGTTSGTGTSGLLYVALSGVDTTTPVDVAPSATAGTTTAGFTIATTGAYIAAHAAYNSSTAFSNPVDSPTGFATIGTGVDGRAVTVSEKLNNATGATGTFSWTATTPNAVGAIAFRPAAAAAIIPTLVMAPYQGVF
jgi:hypothetical protein